MACSRSRCSSGCNISSLGASVRARPVRRLVTGEPTLLVFRGECLPDALRRVRVNGDEIRAAARSAGLASPADARAIMRDETDGSFSVIAKGAKGSGIEGIEVPGQDSRG